LKEYVEIRLISAEDPGKLWEIIEPANIIEQKIWSIVTELTKEEPRDDAINALFVQAVNNMFDDQTKRVTVTTTYRIPTLIWVAVFFLFMISMFGVGYLFGKKKNTDWFMIIGLSLAFSAVILIIIDLDSSKGIIQINYQPLFDLYQRILTG
jgi:hypothetical protein